MYDKTFTTILDKRELLRVKLKNLAQEAALIRREEHRILYVRGGARKLEAAVTAQATVGELRLVRRAMTRKVGDYGLYLELNTHRRTVVRQAARLAHLTYGAIKGRTLEEMEGTVSVPLTDGQKLEIQRLYKKYGARGAAVPSWMAVSPMVLKMAVAA